ncbi:MAG: proline dehydrogenase family protein [Candidatus Aenigmarchaeota archaeon]|nr:proline dehydrogenase family protein [Candidatus Aenigmarchaeota archaeon]
MGLASFFVRRWIAGESVDDAIGAAVRYNSRGMSAIINYLGEHDCDERVIRKNVSVYLRLLDRIHRKKIRASISVKPSQMHIERKLEHCIVHFRKILDRAKKYGTFVWIDMEGSEHTSRTIESYLSLHRSYKNVGMVVQANMVRSQSDLKYLLEKGAVVRLVKGAYRDGKKTVYGKSDVRKIYKTMMRMMFEKSRRFAIATHDRTLVGEALRLSRGYRGHLEFQFLMGIKDDIKYGLADEGYNVSDYVPFGTNWRGYVTRRIRENPLALLQIFGPFIPRKK